MDIQWPGKPDGEMVEAIGIYNTETGEFKLHECVGEALDSFIEDNPDEDADELEASYWREAEDWVRISAIPDTRFRAKPDSISD